MPISRKVLFKCIECGYREYRMIGDVRPDMKSLKPCPICGSYMIEAKDDDKGIIDEVIDKISDIFKEK